jgi:hypothetical protein
MFRGLINVKSDVKICLCPALARMDLLLYKFNHVLNTNHMNLKFRFLNDFVA